MVLFHSFNNEDNIYDESTEDFRDSRVIASDNDKELKLTFEKGDVLCEKLVAVFGPGLADRAECLMEYGYFGSGYGRFTFMVGGHQQWTLSTSYKDKEHCLTIKIEDGNVSNLTKSICGKYERFKPFWLHSVWFVQ